MAATARMRSDGGTGNGAQGGSILYTVSTRVWLRAGTPTVLIARLAALAGRDALAGITAHAR